jgi:hypothetical protein
MGDYEQVKHPSYYQINGVELIQVMRDLPYCRGCAVKYLFRAGVKNPEKELEDLYKAKQMVEFEIQRIEAKLGLKK